MIKGLAIGLVLGVTVWWLLVQRLRAKPWIEKGVIPASQDDFTSNAPKVGLWVFLAMVASLFLIFNSAYLMRMSHGGGGLAAWAPVDEPGVLWLNSIVLTLASIAMQLATSSAERNDLKGVRSYYTAGGVLTLLFLAGQLLAWRQLAATGAYDEGNPAFAFFILLTAVHGLHLIGGLAVAARTASKVWRGVEEMSLEAAGRIRQSVALTTTYWHFLLLVWFGLFALLSFT